MTPKISSRQGLSSLVGFVDWNEFDWAIVESPAEVRLLDRSAMPDAGGFPQGLAFGEFSELRWRKRSAGLHVVYVSDRGRPLEGSDNSQELAEKGSGHIVMWGSRDGEEYYDSRIPGRLGYPKSVPAGQRLAAITKNYELKNGARFFRCAGLEPMK